MEIKTLKGYDASISTDIYRLQSQGYNVEILTTHVDPKNTNQLTVVVKITR